MNRLEKFQSYKTNAWYSRIFKRLSAADIAFAESWITTNDHLDRNDFESAVNRMFIDKQKPKHWTSIQELIAGANV